MTSSAHEVAEQVRSGQRSAAAVLDDSLARIKRYEPHLRAFQQLTLDRARQDAADVDARDSSGLPLAGVPVVVKDDVPVQGVAVRKGSRATDPRPQRADGLLTARLRAAGAVVLGTTRVPEFYVSAATETVGFGTTSNPWNSGHTSGGSSGGTATAVAAGFAPIGVGSDGLGSIRIPAGCCGLFGIKPGPGLVPHPEGTASWFGMSEHGPLATTVSDGALLLDVLADSQDHRDPRPPDGPLRIAMSLAVPVPPARVASSVKAAVHQTAAALTAAGHTVIAADPPYSARLGLETSRRYFTAFLEDADGLDAELFERRIRHQAAIGRLLRRWSPVDPASTDSLRAKVDEWFEVNGIDVCLMPTLLRPPLKTGSLLGRSWATAALIQSAFVQHTYLANLIGYPAASVPAGLDENGLPSAVQLVAPRGGERTILSVAREIEQRRPWRRTADLDVRQ